MAGTSDKGAVITPETLEAALMACFSKAEVKLSLFSLFQSEFEKRDAEIAALKAEVGSLKMLVTRQADDLDDIEQYSRRNILNFNDVAESDGEDGVQLGIDLAKSVGVTVQKADIDRAHRIGQKGKKTASGEVIHRPLLVKFATYTIVKSPPRSQEKGSCSIYPTFLWRKPVLLFDDDLLDNETDVIKSDGKRSNIYHVYGC